MVVKTERRCGLTFAVPQRRPTPRPSAEPIALPLWACPLCVFPLKYLHPQRDQVKAHIARQHPEYQ